MRKQEREEGEEEGGGEGEGEGLRRNRKTGKKEEEGAGRGAGRSRKRSRKSTGGAPPAVVCAFPILVESSCLQTMWRPEDSSDVRSESSLSTGSRRRGVICCWVPGSEGVGSRGCG